MTYDVQLVNLPVTGTTIGNTGTVGFPSDFNNFLCSMWVCLPSPTGGISFSNTVPFFSIAVNRTQVIVGLRKGPSQTIFSGTFDVPIASVRSNIIVSVNAPDQTIQVSVNRQDIPLSTGGWIGPPASFSLTGGLNFWGITGAGSSNPGSGIADLFAAAPDTFFDLSITSNLNKFINPDLSPVDLGGDGSGPLGSSPPIFLTVRPSGLAPDFLTNNGAGGSFTFAGTLAFQTGGVCTLPPIPPPSTPDPFCGVHHTTSSFTASWTPTVGVATSYTVDWRKVGDVSFTEVAGITDTFLLITGLDPAAPYEFKVKAINDDGESDFSGLVTCATIGRVQFLVCDSHWTITQPQTLLYGLDHLAGLSVTGLLDGIPLEPTQVALDGTLTLPFPASSIVIGLGYPVQIQGLYVDAGTPTVQGRRKDITGITARVDASGGPQAGSNQPDGGAQIPVSIDPPWVDLVDMIPSTPKQAYDTYVGPSGQTTTKLYTGDLRANVVPGWDEKGQPALEQTLPLPLSLVALMPEILEGDTPEQAYSQKDGPKHESWPWSRR